MAYSITSLNELTAQFEKLPGIGKKTAQRLAFYVITAPEEYATRFASALTTARSKVHLCSVCQSLTDSALCGVCDDPLRDKSIICVVSDPKDVLAFERTREYKGVYHVLHGVISPLDGVGPEKLKIRELLARLSDGGVKEVIMATDPTVEGEATASYISRFIKPMGIKITRLAYGVPVGGDLEYADEVTLKRALDGRNEI
ncbi:MAG: recombination protein RecR [Ruminococcaceae bacterium]|nr:recombination protein RecR [Oscillospiraceae bacterium]